MPDYRERISTFSPEREAIAAVYDRLGVLLELTAGKKLDLPPFPRPQTAHQRVEAQRVQDAHLSLVKRLTPKG